MQMRTRRPPLQTVLPPRPTPMLAAAMASDHSPCQRLIRLGQQDIRWQLSGLPTSNTEPGPLRTEGR